MLHCTPFLLFDGNCAEAMTFYHQCLGGELTLTKLGETSMKDQFPPEKHNRIINAHLKSGALDISATDWMASPAFEPKQGNSAHKNGVCKKRGVEQNGIIRNEH